MHVHFVCPQFKTQPCPFVRHNHKFLQNTSACNQTSGSIETGIGGVGNITQSQTWISITDTSTHLTATGLERQVIPTADSRCQQSRKSHDRPSYGPNQSTLIYETNHRTAISNCSDHASRSCM